MPGYYNVCSTTPEPVRTYLNHARVISHIVSRPRASVLHCPSFLRNLLSLGNQGIDSNLEFFVISLNGKSSYVSNLFTQIKIP